MGNKVKCWEVLKCLEKECLAYNSTDLKCWLFSGTHCRREIQGKFIEKMEMCLNCEIFNASLDDNAMRETFKLLNRQIKEFRIIIEGRDKELESMGMEFALSISEIFDALRMISAGDPRVRIPETSEIELIAKLKHMINLTAEDIGEIINLSHELAIGISEQFDVLQRVSNGDLNARVSGMSQVELLESLKKATNKMVESISREISQRKQTEAVLRENETHYKQVAERAAKSKEAFFNMLEDIRESYKELEELFLNLISTMVNTLDAKSPWTKGHSVRVAKYAEDIAEEMGLSENEMKDIRLAGILHDIGKIGTYDYLLDKPSKLTDEEFAIVKKHPAQGANILQGIKQLKNILPLIRYHHERIDGRGYPDGLNGEQIPLGAKILHVADSFDSMTADRPYRPAPGKEYARSEFEKYSGIQFDAEVVEVFLRILH
jgi:putative nucleotidyltransferase with HDIG domain